jgi:hypothetical protein
MVDLDAAADFMATHARLLDRRRFDVVVRGAAPDAALAALEAHRNLDGGYGWGLEPDLRSTSSQPGPALHAFEVFEDVAPATSPRAIELCDWLDAHALADGGLPFGLPLDDAAGCAPFWARADPTVSSLQITAIVAAVAHGVAAHDPAVAAHPWLERATRFCLEASAAIGEDPFALELAYAIRLLDAAHGAHPEAADLVARLGRHIPPGGSMHVRGGLEDEMMRPLDFAPYPDGPARELFSPEAIDADLQRLVDGQRDDGGWAVDYASYSPAAALEWRGHITVRALSILKRNSII